MSESGEGGGGSGESNGVETTSTNGSLVQSQSIFDKPISSFTFVEALILVIVGWILITLWERYLLNVFFEQFGFNPKSPLETFAIAITMTIIFLTVIRYAGPLVLGTYNANSGVNSPSEVSRTEFI